MDYSVYDAMRAGFNRVVFIIRRDFEEEFKKVIGSRYADKIKLEYAFQDKNDLPGGFTVPEGREKPWGTGHAVYAARHLLNGPFAVINADDYYGKHCFTLLHDFLVSGKTETTDKLQCCMAGFQLKNTLSDFGTVTRGVCQVENGYLTGQITELVAAEYIRPLQDAGVDALIVADLGGACAIHRAYPQIELHASTQMSGHNLAQAELLAKHGFSRMVCARELPRNDLEYLVKNDVTRYRKVVKELGLRK